MANDMNSPAAMRTALGRVRGLGSARGGTHHWWMQRVTSIALLPLTLWFVAAAIGLAGASRVETLLWIASPLNAVLLLALVGLTFHHMAAGLQVVIEDYVRPESRRMFAVLAMKGVVGLMALACFVAIIRIVAAA
ncbi:succinate dehydrogenase, hydrophobic membrane anchor protein [Roseococcus sp. DSY-14]|uniref:succinate dehydrogenase, hydrophobic membrane anchor protein n=1 Tax=Roseococcus sp. DSY-14 TaxID=3369650 RepID=UPI00387B3220